MRKTEQSAQVVKKLDSREQTKLALEEKLLSKTFPSPEKQIEEKIEDEKKESFALDSSVVQYDEGCCENSVPVLALQYSPHNKNSRVPYIILSFNCCIPGSGTILAACLTES